MGDYTPRPYSDLKARSLVLAAGIEKIASLLPPMPAFRHAQGPCVKWIFLPNRRGDLNDWDNNVEECCSKFYKICEEVTPDLAFTVMGESYGAAFWVWENVRPSVKWVNERLPQIYLLAHACDCNLEGWTYEDDDAWRPGLSKVIDEAGFDTTYTRPGQMS